MKCNNCGQNEAGFFRRSIINGYITETQLCIQCAERLGLVHKLTGSRVFDEFFGVSATAPKPHAIPQHQGTSQPHGAFAPPAVRQTTEIDEDMRRQREINMLREQIKTAAAAEDFEKAISLREDIKRLEN